MGKELLGNLRTYSEVYEYVSKGTRTKEELYRYLLEKGKARSTVDEQVKKVFANQIQLMVIDGERVAYIKEILDNPMFSNLKVGMSQSEIRQQTRAWIFVWCWK